ncbi:MAG: hypothetical protein GTO46_04490, partial [Gemmatimonadetes bacterium]|nr:hypothetical protein [Gemmatimonadota bacterium]
MVVIQKDSGRAPWWVAGLAVAGLIGLAALWILRQPREAVDRPAPSIKEGETAAATANRQMLVV